MIDSIITEIVILFMIRAVIINNEEDTIADIKEIIEGLFSFSFKNIIEKIENIINTDIPAISKVILVI